MNSTEMKEQFLRASKIRGIVASVARQLDLSHEHCRLVAHGKRTSERVSKALLSELRKRQAKEARGRAA